jgi:hypothetical protein
MASTGGLNVPVHHKGNLPLGSPLDVLDQSCQVYLEPRCRLLISRFVQQPFHAFDAAGHVFVVNADRFLGGQVWHEIERFQQDLSRPSSGASNKTRPFYA